ncbi:MAG: hypothetical protein IPI39_16760 [Candidatus Obscuribacter sp.]|nr:hypothetical protein [Candidatus Obscuribacter sp.]MBK9622555.1 hypothetical protein [Candidatus Obscuribacter sp.]
MAEEDKTVRELQRARRVEGLRKVPDDIDQAVALLRRDCLDAEEFVELLLDEEDFNVMSQAYVLAWWQIGERR